MKILVLNGSPTRDGNTVALVNAFKEGAESNGHEVTVLDVAHKKVNGCMSCGYCHGAGNGKCAQKDDMQEIYPHLMEAEMIVFASPIYYFTMSAQLEAVIQRFYAINHPPKAKYTALLLSSYSPDVYTGAIAQYKDMIGYMGMTDRGIVTADNSTNKTPTKLAEARELGASL
ncbi:MAG: flavodoxin family protein [Alphaproteobacteria bacterium]|nr:flavodoxin family protein [Alphaproteobacteria bacterium]